MSEKKLQNEISKDGEHDVKNTKSESFNENMNQTDKFSNEFEKTDNLKGLNESMHRAESRRDADSNPKKKKSHLNSDGFEEEYEDQKHEETKGKNHRIDGVEDEEIAKEFHDDTEPMDTMTDRKLTPKQLEDKFEVTNEFDDIGNIDHPKGKGVETKMKADRSKKVQQPRKLSFETSKKPDFSLNGLILSRMGEYDGLRDENLQVFFAKNNRKKILVKNGLITEDGYIVKKPEEYLKKKDLYFKANAQTEESNHIRAKTFEKKKVNPYKENIVAKRQQSKGKASKGHLIPKTNGEPSKLSQKNAAR